MPKAFVVSPYVYKEQTEWSTPIRAVICGLQRDGKSQRKIVAKTGVLRRLVRRILYQESSRRDRKKKLPRLYLMSIRLVCQCIRLISKY